MTPLMVGFFVAWTAITLLVGIALGVWGERDRWRRNPTTWELPSIRAARHEDAERGRLRIVRGGR